MPTPSDERWRQIEAVLIDREFSTKLSTAAQQAVFKGFTLDTMIHSYDQLYLRLLENDARSVS